MEKKNKNYPKAKEYLDKAIEVLKNAEFERAEGYVQKAIDLIGASFKLFKVVGEINAKDKEKMRSALESLGLILFGKNAYHAAMQSFWMSDILLRQIVEKKSYKYVADKYGDYLFQTTFFMDFTKGMLNWFSNDFESAQQSFKSAIFRSHEDSELIRYLEQTLSLVEADIKFMGLFELDEAALFCDMLLDMDPWESKGSIKGIYEIKNPITHSIPEVTDVIAGRGFCVAVYTHFLRTIFALLKQLEDVTIDEHLIEKIRGKFSQIKNKNEVVEIGEKFLFACIAELVTYKNLKDIPKHRFGRLMNLILPLRLTYSKWMNSLLLKKTRVSFFEKNLLQLNNQIDPFVLLVYEEGVSPKFKEKKSAYARIWTKESKTDGDIINKELFDRYAKNTSSYQICIIDIGEIGRGSIGKIYFGDRLKVKRTQVKNNKKKKVKKDITATDYRLLFHTLKNGGIAGDIFEIIKQCYPEEKPSGHNSWVDYYKKDSTNFWSETSKFRGDISELSNLLNEKIGVQLISRKNKIYKLTPAPTLCLLQQII